MIKAKIRSPSLPSQRSTNFCRRQSVSCSAQTFNDNFCNPKIKLPTVTTLMVGRLLLFVPYVEHRAAYGGASREHLTRLQRAMQKMLKHSEMYERWSVDPLRGELTSSSHSPLIFTLLLAVCDTMPSIGNTDLGQPRIIDSLQVCRLVITAGTTTPLMHLTNVYFPLGCRFSIFQDVQMRTRSLMATKYSK